MSDPSLNLPELRGWLHLLWGTVTGIAAWAYTSTNARLTQLERDCEQAIAGSQRTLNEHMISAARDYVTRAEVNSLVEKSVEPLRTAIERIDAKLDRLLEKANQDVHARRT